MPVWGALVGKSAKREAPRVPFWLTPMWTLMTIAGTLLVNRMATSQWDQQAPVQLDPAAHPPTSRGEIGRGGSGHLPAGRSGALQGGIMEPEWWAVSSVYTRACLALRLKWVVRRPYDPPPPASRDQDGCRRVAAPAGLPPPKRRCTDRDRSRGP